MSFRTLTAAVAAISGLALTAVATAPAAAQTDPSLAVQVKMTDLHTAAGQADVRRQLEAAADAFCRANPGEGRTVYSCRTQKAAELERDLTARTGIALNDTSATRLASK